MFYLSTEMWAGRPGLAFRGAVAIPTAPFALSAPSILSTLATLTALAALMALTALLTLLPATASQALEVRFAGSAEVEGASIRLGDIADFDEESDTSRALASQLVAQAPPAGESILLATQAVIGSLQSSLPLPADMSWRGAATIVVSRRGVVIGPERLQEIIADFLLEKKAEMPPAAIRFIPQSLPLPFILPIGELSHEVIPSTPSIIGSSRLAIIFRVDGRVVKNLSLRGSIEALAPVVVAAESLPRGSLLQSGHLSTSPLDLTGLNGASGDPDRLVGKRLTRNVRAGSPILATMVEEVPIVQRGEMVKMVISSGPLQLSASGMAHSNGGLHEVIRVQNSSSNKIVNCRVAAPGLVEVLL